MEKIYYLIATVFISLFLLITCLSCKGKKYVLAIPDGEAEAPKALTMEPYISIDSLTIMRELWESVITSPSSKRKAELVETDYGNIAISYEDSYGLEIFKIVDHAEKGKRYKGAVYWRGSKELPANYMVADSTTHLYQWIDNPPQFPYKGGDRDYVDAIAVLKQELGLSPKGHTKVRFVVEADGTVSNAHVIKSQSPREDYFAMVIVTYLLKFTPPTHRGKPCRIVYQLPL